MGKYNSFEIGQEKVRLPRKRVSFKCICFWFAQIEILFLIVWLLALLDRRCCDFILNSAQRLLAIRVAK
jgi:hypothetical protein